MFEYIKNNLASCLTLFLLIPSTIGAINLFAYSHKYGLVFFDFINSQLMMATGVLYLCMIAASMGYFLIFFFLITKLSNSVFIDIPNAERKDYSYAFIVSICMAILALAFLLILIDTKYIYLSSIFILLSFLFYIFIINKKSFLGYLKVISCFAFFIIITSFLFYIASLVFIFINKIDNEIYLSIALSIIYFFSGIRVPVIKTENRKNEYYTYASIVTMIIFILPLTTDGGNNVIKTLGIGYENRCFYSRDLNTYHIPDNVQVPLNDEITQLFILSDVSNVMNLGVQENRHISKLMYSFKHENLSRISCDLPPKKT